MKKNNLKNSSSSAKHPLNSTDTMIKTTTPKKWIAYWTFGSLLFMLLMWSIFGSIPIQIQGRGIIMNALGVYDVQAQVLGIINKIHTNVGDSVKKGDLIIEVWDPQTQLKLTHAKFETKKLEDELFTLKTNIERETKANRESLTREIESRQFAIKSSRDQLKIYKTQLDSMLKLLPEGLVPISEVENLKKEIYNTRAQLANAKANLEKTKSDLNKAYRIPDLQKKEQELLEAKNNESLLFKTSQLANIYTPYDGYVLSILVNAGDEIKEGTSVARFERRNPNEPKKELTILGFMDVNEGKKIFTNTELIMEVSQVDAAQYGALVGRAQSISTYALSEQALLKTIHNPGLIKFLMNNQDAVIQVSITPEKDPLTFSGYKWTSGEGPPIKLETGSVGVIKGTVSSIRPIFYIVPTALLKYLPESLINNS